MLCFFTTLAIGYLPLWRADHASGRAIETAFPVLQNHIAEICGGTACASVQALVPPSTVRLVPVM
jgi:hypothetical protein